MAEIAQGFQIGFQRVKPFGQGFGPSGKGILRPCRGRSDGVCRICRARRGVCPRPGGQVGRVARQKIAPFGGGRVQAAQGVQTQFQIVGFLQGAADGLGRVARRGQNARRDVLPRRGGRVFRRVVERNGKNNGGKRAHPRVRRAGIAGSGSRRFGRAHARGQIVFKQRRALFQHGKPRQGAGHAVRGRGGDAAPVGLGAVGLGQNGRGRGGGRRCCARRKRRAVQERRKAQGHDRRVCAAPSGRAGRDWWKSSLSHLFGLSRGV